MLTLPATIGLTDAKAVMRPLADAISREPADRLTVDAAGLRQFDSSALAVLLECRRLAEKSGRSFQLSGAPPRLSQLARLYGVAELLGFAPVQETSATA
jgi:phospholipid transport system transporter-binding protein